MGVINYREMYIKIILCTYKDDNDNDNGNSKYSRKDLNKYNLYELKKICDEIQMEENVI